MPEVEVKYRIHDLDAVLAGLVRAGARLGPPVEQDDQAYAPQGWRYDDSKDGVTFARLRTEDGCRHLFTTKRPRENHLACDEYETQVADRDQMHGALLLLGYRPTTRIVKTRRAGRLPVALGEVSVCVDEVDGVGPILELERKPPAGVSGDVVQAQMAAWVDMLGLPVERTDATIDELVHASAA